MYSFLRQKDIVPSRFNGTTSKIVVAGGGTAQESGRPVTILAHVYKHGLGEGNIGTIYSRSLGTNQYLTLSTNPSSGLGFRLAANSSGNSGAPHANTEGRFPATLRNWVHIAGVWDGSLSSTDMRMYAALEGEPLTLSSGSKQSGTTALLDDSNATINIGNRDDSARTWDGWINYVAQWDRELSLPELLLAQKQGPEAVPNGLVMLYKNGTNYSSTSLSLTSTDILLGGPVPVNRYETVQRNILAIPSGSSSNISGNPTESVDTSSGTLSLSLAISGAVSEVIDSATGQVSNVVSLTGTVTENTDVSTGSVDLEVNVTGTTVEQLDTSSGTVSISDGSVYISGTITETRDTGSGSVDVVTAVEGVVTEGSDTVSGTLQTTVSLTGTVLENSDSITGSVSILGALSVTGTVTESSDALSGYLDNPEAQVTKGGNGKAKLKKKKKVKVSVDTSELDTLVQQLQTDGKTYAVTQIESVKNILEYSELEIPATFSEAVVIAETLVKTSVETTDEWALNMIKTLLTHILVLQDKLQDAEDVILLLSSD